MVETEINRVEGLMARMEPRSLSAVIGQPELVEALGELLEASERREHPLPAILLVGPAETGKRAISTALAMEIIDDSPESFRSIDAAGVCDPQSMREALYGLADNAVLRLIGVHRLESEAYQILARSVREFEINDDSAVSGGDVERDLELPLFSAIATSQADLGGAGPSLEEQVARDWISLRVVPYELESLIEIAHRSADRLGLSVTEGAVQELVRRSEGLPGRLQRIIATVVASWDEEHSATIIDERALTQAVL